ncbi:MAG: site-specific DNA-methyltransferase [Halofilum sp. (in: g-proteobacteria)]
MGSRIREAILAVVPADGTRIGNQKLAERVWEVASSRGDTFSDDEVETERQQLIADGVLGKGRGRGGSVYRMDAPANGTGTGGQAGPPAKHSGPDGPPLSGSGRFGSYEHPNQATLRPDVGLQDQFRQMREPKTYRYDSSLAPELAWDENAEREFAEWLLELVADAAEKGEKSVFAEPQCWQGTGEAFRSSRECVARLKSLTQPYVNWAGKSERQQIAVPTVPLFVHERHSTRAILEKLQSYKSSGQNLELFGDPQADISDKLDAYEHTGPWTNRMILGDSLQVMNTLLEYEGLGGQVQMIYIDPPYGVKFGSNFQPFVRKRDVKHGKDAEMIREPEMVKAYRDTWELGLHSYLSYLRDRLLLARELLTESGSIFVQISDENLHHVREIVDEVFSSENFCAVINFRKTSGASSPQARTNVIGAVSDYVLWYAKDKERVKYNQLYVPRPWEPGSPYKFVEVDGKRRKMTPDEASGVKPLPEGGRVFRLDQLSNQSIIPSCIYPLEVDGKSFDPPRGRHWATTKEGMEKLKAAGRVMLSGNTPSYVRYHDDFGHAPLANWWDDTAMGGFVGERLYVVQTSPKVIHRCLLMATDPGDLVVDPTCGGGTTAFVAEQWGRRWITCDTSRVPLALARQRLLTATFPWYELNEPQRGPAGGFVYRRKHNRKGEEVGGRVPRITLKSIANDEEPEIVTLVDRPEENKKTTRVCGSFTVEATIQAAATLDETAAGETAAGYENPRAYLDRMIEVLRRAHNLQLPGNQSLALGNVRPIASCEWLHAEAQTEGNGEVGQRVAVAFGPEDGAIHSQQVYEAAREAYFLKYDRLYIFGFAIQAKARELVEDRAKLRIPCTYVNVTPDVVMADLLKTSHTDQIFSVTGLPDVQLKAAGQRDNGEPLYQTVVRGLDVFRPDSLETESVAAENLPCWMLDTDYNGLVFCASQVFFPRTGAWDNLKKSLKAEFDDSVWEHLAGTESEPFALGSERCIAVKVVDERGNELMVVRAESEASDG